VKNILIFGDLHISQSSIKECITILEEIGMLANKYNVDTLINLGDTFDNLKPSSLELDVLATFIYRINKKIIIIAADSHESETKEKSILNHYGILSDRVTIVKEYKDENHLYCGHLILNESSKNFGAPISKEAFKNYLYVFLGHQHSYEMIKPNCVQLGSCRYVNFDEVQDTCKIVSLITDYGETTEKVHFLKLKSPITMVQLELSKETQEITSLVPNNEAPAPKELILEGESASNLRQNRPISEIIAKLDRLDSKTKVKVKILDFESFRQFLPLCHKYSSKFEVFKYSTEFNVVSDLAPTNAKTEMNSFKESFSNWLKNQKIDPKIIELLQKELK